MRALNDATAGLARALTRYFAGFELRFEELRSTYWASATYAGTRHEIAFSISGDGASEAARAFADGLAECEFALPRHVVVDIDLVRADYQDGCASLAIEALTIEDC